MQKISDAISSSLSEQGYINQDETEIYEYCLDYVVSQIKYDVLIILIGLLLHQVSITITFLFAFSFLRRYAGGYHAPTPLMCTIMSYMLYFAILAGALYIPAYMPLLWVITFICIISVIVILSPVSTPAKPLSNERRRKMKLCSLIISVLLVLMFVLCYFLKATKYYITLELCVIIVFIMQLIQLLINIRKRKE